MMEGFSEIMTLEKTAKYLKIGKSTLYKMAREGKIPTVKIEIGEKEILGYKSSKTTEIYTHVSKASLTNIKNPLDSIFREEKT